MRFGFGTGPDHQLVCPLHVSEPYQLKGERALGILMDGVEPAEVLSHPCFQRGTSKDVCAPVLD